MPTDPVSIAVALADKIDTLVGFWAIDEKPTGSKDPFALRRAALGVIRLILDNRTWAADFSVAQTPLADAYVERHMRFLSMTAAERIRRCCADIRSSAGAIRERIVDSIPHEMTLDRHAIEEYRAVSAISFPSSPTA